ncbi:2'-5' RNA ligase family protein [Pseudoxanthomonas suwonensis]|uniref:2'-5' RNA ligase n=1 Tax=Pseudoxanthomonas suwonensis TaxID=314722 RepID=A0A0E3Z0W3_9GAMM|nr:hypothetical protein [Pseudoxanthomonas suwonensis]AKC86387.1 hypothetical protein WQ53_05995 [Pseudoxanthomonas suwonensis]
MAQPGELFVMARVPGPVRDALLHALSLGGLEAKLGRALYPPRNWHQTLSALQPAEALEPMRRACAGLDARAFDMPLDRLESSGAEPGRIHWQFVPSGGKPDGLALLLADVKDRLRGQAIADTQGHRAHVTVSYNAHQGIGRLDMPPVHWPVDAVELVQVAGRGADYRYDVVEAWPLRPSPTPAPIQFGLLG